MLDISTMQPNPVQQAKSGGAFNQALEISTGKCKMGMTMGYRCPRGNDTFTRLRLPSRVLSLLGEERPLKTTWLSASVIGDVKSMISIIMNSASLLRKIDRRLARWSHPTAVKKKNGCKLK
jgi:hypothetical protein